MRARLAALPLARLETRRAIRCAAPAAAGVAWLLAAGSSGLARAAEALPADRARFLLRESAWSVALVLLAAGVAWHGASRFTRWRNGEGEWLGAAPVRAGTVLASAWSASAFAALAAVAALLLAIEGSARAIAPGPTVRVPVYAGRYLLARARAVDAGRPLLLEVADPGVSGSLRVATRALAGTGEVTAELTLERGGAPPERVEGVVSARGWLEASLPAGEGPVTLVVRVRGPGAVLVAGEPGVEVWRAGAGETRASLALALRAFAWLAGLGAVALALGAWMSAPIAAAGALVAAAAAALSGSPPRALPGARLARALEWMAEGRQSESLPASAGLGLAAVLAAAYAVARPGLRSWRRGS